MRDVEAPLNSLVSIGRNGLKAILASEATVAVGLPGQERTESCSFGRLCTVFSVEGTDVGRILVAEHLAHTYAKRAFLGPLRARASACFDCGNSISIHYPLICVIAPGQQRHCLAAVSRKGLMAVGGRQSADVSVAKDRRGVASPAASSGKRQSRAARNPYRNTYQGWAGNPFRGDLPDTSGFLLRRRVPASLRNRSVPSCSGHPHASSNLAAGGRARDG